MIYIILYVLGCVLTSCIIIKYILYFTKVITLNDVIIIICGVLAWPAALLMMFLSYIHDRDTIVIYRKKE